MKANYSYFDCMALQWQDTRNLNEAADGAFNPGAEARSQLPHIPVVPDSHEQPSPLYKVSLSLS